MAETTPTPDLTPESIQAAGDIVIEEVYLTTPEGELDIREFCAEIQLFEDMFSPVLMGSIVVIDAAGLITKAPIVEGQAITIVARTPTLPNSDQLAFRRTFMLTGLTDRGLARDREQVYVLHFMSPEGVRDNLHGVVEPLKGTTDTIVQKVFDTYLKAPRYIRDTKTARTTELTIAGTPHKSFVKVVPAYWHPLKVINWCAVRAVSSQGTAPNFLFFESNKQFYFTSVENLVEVQRNNKQVFAEYFLKDAGVRDPNSQGLTYTAPDIGEQYTIIRKINVPKQWDLLQGQDYGYYAGTLVTHDITLKEVREYPWDYHAKFSKFNHMEDYSASSGDVKSQQGRHQPFPSGTPRSGNSFVAVRTKHYALHSEYVNNKVEHWGMQRNSLMYGLSNLRVQIEVAGRTDIEIGRLVYLHFPMGADKTVITQDNFDPYMSGLYLIAAIRHVISMTGKHIMTMELVKDSFKQPLD